jgi:hypothetical protein
MALFICENCGCIENTALGFYWGREFVKFKDESMDGKALCSECAPSHFADGTRAGRCVWHGRFEKVKFDPLIHKFEDYVNGEQIKKQLQKEALVDMMKKDEELGLYRE